MAEAHAQQRQLALQPAAAFNRNPGLTGRAGTRGNDHAFGIPFEQLVNAQLIVAKNLDIQARINLPQPLHEVVGERIVIIDDEDHAASKWN